MDEKFFGTASSDLAKERYVPVSHNTRKENILLGVNTSEIFYSDPKLLGFVASKHKFVGKMLEGSSEVLEIGCMDGFGSAIVSSFVDRLLSIDFYRSHIEQAQQAFGKRLSNVEFKGMDFLDEPFENRFDGAFALDVLEHIDPQQEPLFLSHVVQALKPDGVFIVGMPSLESQEYASETNRFSHINCQTQAQLTKTLKTYFTNVFPFGMNDEVLHTGYGKMCHYLINICAGPKKQ